MDGDGSQAWNQMDGSAEAVVQAGAIHGGVHFHGAQRPAPKPQLLPAATRNFTNQVRVLAAADRAVSDPLPDADPRFVVFEGPPGIGKRQTARFWLHRRVKEFADSRMGSLRRPGREPRSAGSGERQTA